MIPFFGLSMVVSRSWFGSLDRADGLGHTLNFVKSIVILMCHLYGLSISSITLARFASLILLLHFLSHSPLHFLLDDQSAMAISDFFPDRELLWYSSILRTGKVFSFDIYYVKQSSHLQTIIVGYLPSGFLALQAVINRTAIFDMDNHFSAICFVSPFG
jgi:hypothetical protein